MVSDSNKFYSLVFYNTNPTNPYFGIVGLFIVRPLIDIGLPAPQYEV